MEFSPNQKTVIQTIAKDPAYPRAASELSSLFWSCTIEGICENARAGKDVNAFIDKEKSIIDIGLIAELRDDARDVQRLFNEAPSGKSFVKIDLFSQWLKELLEKTKENDRAEFLRAEIAAARMQLKRAQKEVTTIQEERHELLARVLGPDPDKPTIAAIENLVGIDKLALESMRIKRSIAHGVFFPIAERRAFVEKEGQLKKESARIEALISHIKTETEKTAARMFAHQLIDAFNACLDYEEAIFKTEQQVQTLKDKQNALSPIEIESRIRSEIDYLRELVRLCAKRLHSESCPILRKSDAYFTQKEFLACINRILEFDPRLFQNDRVSFQGRPSFLLIPGNGFALYDWKNNRFIIPILPPGGNFIGSIASAIIEYRIDVDEEKTMIASYSKLPHLKGIRSIIQIRAALTKDYLAWMTSESKGFKIMPKETRAWFEHEIAPGKNDIYCPAEFQLFNVSAEAYRKMLADIEARVADNLSAAVAGDLWICSILNYQQGKFERAFECVKEYVAREPGNVFAHYNLGQIGLKVSHKTEALAGFTEFCKRNPQSWWATVVQEHLRRLQVA